MQNRLAGVVAVATLILCAHASAQTSYVSEIDTPDPRSQTAVAADHLGRIHIMGGYDDNGSVALARHDIYTPATDVWTTGAELGFPTRGACAATDERGLIYVFGGFDEGHLRHTQIYDPRNDVWSQGTAAPASHGWECSAALASDGKIWVTGGQGDRNAVSIYTPSTDVWTTGEPMRTGRYAHGSAFLANGRLYVFGGQDALTNMEFYDAIEQQWGTAAPMPSGTSFFAYGVIENTIYVTGGSTNGGNGGSPFFKETYYYDGSIQQWQTGPDDLQERREAGSAVIGDTLHIVGGNRGRGQHAPSHTRMGPKFLFDSLEPASGSSTSRGSGASCGTRITPQATIELTNIAALASLTDDADVKFVVFEHDGENLIHETTARRFRPNGMTWKLSEGFNLTLQAGRSYDISMTTTLSHQLRYDTTRTEYNSVKSESDNPNLEDYSNPVVRNHGGADCAIRLYGTVNNPPTADAGGPYTVDEGGSVTLQGVGSDPEGSQVSYAWDLDGDNQFDDAFGANPTFTGVDGPATILVSLQVSDGNLTATDSATITVENVDPSIGQISPPNPFESATASFVAPNVSDPAGNNDPLSYLWEFGDNTTSTAVSPTKVYADQGTYSARLTVTDDDGGSDTVSFTVNVRDVLVGMSNPTGPSSIAEGTQGTWRTVIGKASQDLVGYFFIWGDSSPNSSGSLGVGVTTQSVPRSHTYADDGVYTLRIRALDDDNNQVQRTVQINVTNVAPTIVATNVVPNTGPEGTTFDFSASATDPGADTLSYGWDFGDNSSGNGASVSHTYTADGTYLVQLRVTDDDGGGTTTQFELEVTNGAPVIDDVDYDGRGFEGDTLSFEAFASDPGNDPLTYAWTFGDGGTATGPNVTHVYRDEGAYTVILTVTDDAGASTSTTLGVDVGNRNPTLGNVSVPQGVLEGSAATFSASATDPGADTLTFTWTFEEGETRTGPTVQYVYPDDGTFQVNLVVSDGDGGTDEQDLSVTIGNANPSVDVLNGDFAGAEGGNFSYNAQASDPGDDTLTFSWNFGDGSDPVSGTNLTQVEHVYADAGLYNLELTVEDEDGGSTRVERQVNVGGEGPSIGVLDGDTSGNEGGTFAFGAMASDPGGDTITYSWDFGDGSDLLVGEELMGVEHTYAENGTYTLTLTVSDPDGEASATLDIEVANVAPTVGEFVVPFLVNEGQSFGLEATASDPGGENDPLTFAWDFGDGNTAGGAQTTHAYGAEGQFTVRLTVSDDDNGQTSVTRTVTVENVAPTITGFVVPETGNEAQQLTFSATATDPADSLTYNWDFGNGQTAQGATVNPTYADDGEFTVTLTVDDGTEETTRQTTIDIANLAPNIVFFNGRQIGGENQNFPFSANATDPAGERDPLTYRWSFGDGTPEISGVGLINVDHVYTDAGLYTVRVTVTDGDGGSASRSLVVRVANLPPSIDDFEAETEGDEGDSFTFAAIASDPGNDPLTFNWSFGDGTPDVSGIGLDELSHTFADDGVYTVTLTVSDGVDEDEVTVDVAVANVDPTIVAMTPPQATIEGVAGTYTARASDPAGENDPLTYTWSFGDGSDDQTGATVQHTYPNNGTYALTLTVTDGDGGEAQQVLELDLDNAAPVIDAFAGPEEVDEGSEARFVASASDVPADTLTYTWSFEDGPNPSGVDLTQAAHTYPDDGVFNVELIVTDEDGGQAAQTRSLEVRNVDPTIDTLTGVFSGAEGDTFNFEAAASDPGDDTLTYRWTFGDDVEFTEGVDLTGVSHVYDTAGQYDMTLTVTDGDGGSVSITRSVNVGIAAPVIESFEAPDGGVEGQTLTFTASATDPVNQELTYIWNFGDGSPTRRGVDLTSVEHTFADDGAYFVRLIVTDPDELQASAGESVTITNAPPVIDTFVLGAFAENQEGTAMATASDPAGVEDPLTYTWDFGDGSPTVAGVDLTSAPHTYASNGDYTVTLTVTDGDGGSVSRSGAVSVGDAAPIIEGVDGDREGDEGDTLQFQARAVDLGGDALTYTWQVDDNDPVDTDDNPSFRATFADDGTYTIALTVTDEEGQAASTEFDVTIANLAPVIQTLTGRDSGDEGQLLSFFGLATDAAGDNDPLTYEWSFGDNGDNEEDVDLTTVDHAYADDGEYTLTLVVRDDDGGESTETLVVTVANVAPTIVSDPPVLAIVNREYRYSVGVEDPGNDTITYELLSGPEGMAFDSNELVWTLALEDLDAGPFPVSIRVTDGDGGEDTQAWEIGTDFIDGDEDGVPDDCEELYGLDPNDPNDGDQDADEDGITNRDECLGGTNPVVFNGPSAPVADSPIEGARVDTSTPELVVENAADPDGDDLTYTFEVYADEELEDLVTSIEGLSETPGTTSWTVDVELREDAVLYWRARATDSRVAGPWSEPESFLVDAENSPPSVPVLVSPVGTADSPTPDLVVDVATDPEGDAISYVFELYGDAELSDLIESGETDETTHPVGTELTEDAQYHWRARAVDAEGAESEWSLPATFVVNMENNLPGAPAIVAPEDGGEVYDYFVLVEWSAAEDVDGDRLTYELQVAEDDGFTTLVHDEDGIPADGAANVAVEVGELSEDTLYHVRVRAFDPFGAGPYTMSTFTVNVENGSPGAPVLISPIDDAVVHAGTVKVPTDVELVFENVEDPDGDNVFYTVRVFDDEGLSNEVFVQEDVQGDGDTTTVKWDVQTAGKYWWTVRATDGEGGGTSEPGSFEVVIEVGNAPPSAPVPLSPKDETIEGPFELVAENAVDPDGDILTYGFEIFADEELTQSVFAITGVSQGSDGTTSTPVSDLDVEDGARLWWVAKVTDGVHDTIASEAVSFDLTATATEPEPASDCECATPARPAETGWLRFLLRR